MNRRDFIKRTSSLLTAGAVVLAGSDVLAQYATSDGNGEAVIFGYLDSVSSDSVLHIRNEESLIEKYRVEVSSDTLFSLGAQRPANSILDLVLGEILVAEGVWNNGTFLAKALVVPTQPIEFTVSSIKNNVVNSKFGPVEITSETQSIEGELENDRRLNAKPVHKLAAGDKIEGLGIFDPGRQVWTALKIGVVSN